MKNLFNPLVLFLTLNSIGVVADNAAPDNEPLRDFPVSKVNILELGAKNDGSDDVSDLVNRYTTKYALYFPAGSYKVSKPLFLKNPISGDGYARTPNATVGRTWLISAIDTQEPNVGVINFDQRLQITITDLNIKCHSHECGIRIAKCAQSTATFIDRVGIFNMRSYGLYIQGGGSRPIFAQNMTIFSSNDWPVPCTAIYNGPGVCDNRFSNIEMMGIRVGMEVCAAYTYANNLHIWTGCMPQKDRNGWWRGTRGIVLSGNASFIGSQIYPDTCFYALEQRSPTCIFDIQNIMYWEDGSLRECPDFDGAFFHCPGNCNGTLKIIGGVIGVNGNGKTVGHMKNVYAPNQHIENVTVLTDYPVKGEFIDKLCFSSDLPDYGFRYNQKGYCKVADIFTVAKTGACEAVLTLDDGAAFQLSFVKDASGTVTHTAQPLNPLCAQHDIKMTEDSDVVRVFVKHDSDDTLSGRFVTRYMTTYMRPLDYSHTRTRARHERCQQVLETLD